MRVSLNYYATAQSIYNTTPSQVLFPLFDDLQKVDHENLSSPRASDISQTLFVVFPVGSFYFELALPLKMYRRRKRVP